MMSPVYVTIVSLITTGLIGSRLCLLVYVKNNLLLYCHRKIVMKNMAKNKLSVETPPQYQMVVP